jgi:hypothetical protein
MIFTVGFFDDGDNHFAGDVAAHDERIGFVEFSCVNEFQETFLGSMQICSKEDLGAQLTSPLILTLVTGRPIGSPEVQVQCYSST